MMTQILKIVTYASLLFLIALSCEPTAENSGTEAGPGPLNSTTSSDRPNSNAEDERPQEGEEEGESEFSALMLEFKSVLIDEMISPQWNNINAWENACVEARSVESQAKLLIEFETGILWGGVSGKWKGRRASWLSDVENAGTLFELGRLLAELETNVTWASVDQSWKTRREGWLKEVTTL